MHIGKERREMLVVDEQYMVKRLSVHAAYKALGHGIHIRRSNRRSDHLRANALRRAVECRAELVTWTTCRDATWTMKNA
jgi:hypothetical protein